MKRIVLVTGATSGFGWEIATTFAKAGDAVIATGRRKERLEELKNSLPEADIFPLVMDVTCKEEVAKAIASLPVAYQAVDILVNNAGLALGLEKAPEASLEDWEIMVDTNIKGVLYVTKAVISGMKERKRGYIFNIGSTAGNWPYEGGNVYGATKAFVKQFSLNLRTDLKGTNIRVTNIEPGFAKTDFSLVRFKGNETKADAVYKDTKPLEAADIANVIFTCANFPEHVNVNFLEVMSVRQSYGGLVVEKD
ncbi:MAG: SDR family NAD(P)-dependent oxidoreductase [Campylobacterales bacterium]|nr:SDR family NAD(P)-dependent oxidoreductase [Campylobacterales bacterium]